MLIENGSADPDEKKLVSLKVGRATNLNRRMDQWGKQCGSKEQILRGFWPGGMGKEGVPMKGLVQAGPKGPWCHRLERLVHIELSDLATTAPYLEAGYPNVEASKEADKGGKRDVKKCPDCMYFSFPSGWRAHKNKKVQQCTKKFSHLKERREGDTRAKNGQVLSNQSSRSGAAL
jgi:hypothetical protein